MNRRPRSITVHIDALEVNGLDHRAAQAISASLGATLEGLLGGNAVPGRQIKPSTSASDANETRDDPSGPRMLGAAAAEAIRRNLNR